MGLPATQRPLADVARFLGGTESSLAVRRSPVKKDAKAPQGELAIADEFAVHRGTVRYRPVTIVDAGQKKALELTIEVPVEDMAKLARAESIPSGPAHLRQGPGGPAASDARPSLWAAVHPRLLEV